MIIVIDALNKHKFKDLLDEMFRLRARVFGGRLGWDVNVREGMERDGFDNLDPAYAVGLDDQGNVVSCVRALQTTGPHMLSHVFSDILDGEPPLRSPQIWESTRFCVDTARLGADGDRQSVSRATCELMIASLETAMRSGVTDIVTVIDPIMNRVLKRSGNAPYDYLGRTVPMGKVPAMAALLDCTQERVNAIRAFSGIDYDVFLSDEEARVLFGPEKASTEPANDDKVINLAASARRRNASLPKDIDSYCNDQINEAQTPRERRAAHALRRVLEGMNNDKIA